MGFLSILCFSVSSCSANNESVKIKKYSNVVTATKFMELFNEKAVVMESFAGVDLVVSYFDNEKIEELRDYTGVTTKEVSESRKSEKVTFDKDNNIFVGEKSAYSSFKDNYEKKVEESKESLVAQEDEQGNLVVIDKLSGIYDKTLSSLGGTVEAYMEKRLMSLTSLVDDMMMDDYENTVFYVDGNKFTSVYTEVKEEESSNYSSYLSIKKISQFIFGEKEISFSYKFDYESKENGELKVNRDYNQEQSLKFIKKDVNLKSEDLSKYILFD